MAQCLCSEILRTYEYCLIITMCVFVNWFAKMRNFEEMNLAPIPVFSITCSCFMKSVDKKINCMIEKSVLQKFLNKFLNWVVDLDPGNFSPDLPNSKVTLKQDYCYVHIVGQQRTFTHDNVTGIITPIDVFLLHNFKTCYRYYSPPHNAKDLSKYVLGC